MSSAKIASVRHLKGMIWDSVVIETSGGSNNLQIAALRKRNARDLVAALQWVRNNIANFGGDPDRVMIYGQSGGGSKVTTLLSPPSDPPTEAGGQSSGGSSI